MLRTASATIALTIYLAAGSASAQDVARGQKAYADSKCSTCHAVAGKGNAKGALDTVGAKLTADEIREWITKAPEMAAKAKSTRKPAMKAYADLSKQTVDDLVAYLATLKK